MAQITGTSGNDRLVGTTGADTMSGLGGNDTFVGGSGGADVIDGGAGFDTVEFGAAAPSAITVDFRNGTIFGPASASISFTSIERVVGSSFNDSLTGNGSGQNLAGQAGADTIWGAGGVDTLWGGSGSDSFIFRETGIAHADLIGDFGSGVDKIQLDATVMTALGASGNFAAGDARFWAAAGATGGHDADDRVVYDTTTRKLYYDPDGSGSAGAQLIATLQSGATFAATDIVVENGSSGGGGQVINGTSSNDSLAGTTGDDTINGLGGNDTLQGSAGNDRLDGGAGDDSLRGAEGADTFVGGDGNDTLDGDDSRMGETDSEVETLDGGLGNDRFIVDNAADLVSDAGGIDTIVAVNIDWTLGAGFENLVIANGELELRKTGIGNELNNNMAGGDGAILEGRGGNDTLISAGGDEAGQPSILMGGDGNDDITSQGRNSLLDGGNGNDTLNGGPDTTTMDGGAGNDVLSGGDFQDVFLFSVAGGTANADQITDFAAGVDTIQLDGNAYANSGASGRFAAGDGRFAANSTGTAQDASDRVIYNTTTRQIFYDADGSGGGTAQLVATLQSGVTLAATDIEIINGSGGSGQVITGTEGSDNLQGGPGDDTLNGLGGNDTFVGGSGGADVIDGGAGFDTIQFGSPAPSAVVVDFRDGTIFGPGTASISFTGIERVIGSNFNDSLTGNASGQNLSGQAGADTLWGAGGVDTLWGGGGAGDTFIFRETGIANADLISDFTSGVDKIQLDATVMTALGASGNFAAGDARFWAAAGATGGHDADDRVVYDTTTRKLYYDPDGSGSAAAQLIATLQSGATLAATDITVEGGSSGGGGQVINGTAGNDSLAGGPGDDTINGFGGDDSLDGAGGSDSLDGGSGNDYLRGGIDVDRVGEGADILIGGDGNDTLDGWSNDDRTQADLNADTLDGGLGNDVFNVDNRNDILRDAGGVDTVQVRTGGWTLGAGLENLIIFDQEDGPDLGRGNELDNVIESRAWEAELEGMGGNDLLIVTGHSGGREQHLRGGDGNDTLIGSADTTRTSLDGGAGDDSLVGAGAEMIGGDGNDTLVGGKGHDWNLMTGGGGADRIVLTSADNFNLLRDFTSGSDRLVLDGNAFAGSGASGDLAAGDERFYAAAGATGAHDATDRIIFDTSTGDLYYDADGTGSGAAQHIGRVTGIVAATDITIINGSAPAGQTINGTDGNDSLVGTAGNDTIDGRSGNDWLFGDEGNDSLVGGAGNDTIIGGPGNDTFDGGLGDDLLSSRAVDGATRDLGEGELYLGGEGNDTIVGSSLDTMDGGAGNDRYEVWETHEVVSPTIVDSAGIDTMVAVSMNFTLPAGIENLVAADDPSGGTGRGVTLIGNELDNVIDANGAENGSVLEGRAGDDTLIGHAGGSSVDTMDGGAGNDQLIGDWNFNDAVFAFSVSPGAANADEIIGFNAARDTIRLDGNAHLNSGPSGRFAAGDARFYAADDATSGHDASDRVVFNTSTRQLFYDADGSGAGSAQLIATVPGGAILSATDFEIVNGSGGPTGEVFNGTAGNDALVGGDGNDTLNGFAGNDTLDGASGADSMVGGTGADLYFVDAEGDVVVEQQDGGIDEVRSDIFSYVLPDWVDNLALGTDAFFGTGNAIDNVIVGNASRNDLIGAEGNDTLWGGANNDVLDGGVGADTFVLAAAPGETNADHIFGFVSGVDTIQLDGNFHANSGPSGRFLPGDARFAANPTGTAQDASDRVIYNTTTQQVFYDADGSGGASAQLIAALQSGVTLAATDIEIINGSGGSGGGQVITGTSGNDSLRGGAGDDTLNGLGGDDTLDGQGGADSMAGGDGNDLYFVDNDGDIVVETQTGGIDEIRSSIAHTTMQQWVNNLSLVGDQVISGFGNEIDNVLTNASVNVVQLDGYLGNDTLIGGVAGDELNGWQGDDSLVGGGGNDTMDGFNHPQDGIDTMDGGSGDDQYFVTAGDVLIDSAGTDTVFTDISWSLAAGFENLTMTGSASLQMQGNNSDNFVVGNSGNNYFNARAGSDTIQAGGGNDSIDMSSGGTGNHGNDVVDGGVGFDNIDYDGYATRGIIANWNTGTISGGDAAGSVVSFTSVEAIVGAAFADQMTGNASGQNLTGKGGNDTLWGAGGADTLWGGTGADSFVFREMGTANADRIGDFASGSDKVQLDDSAFTAIGALGNFASGDGRFWAAAGATAGHDANDRVVYNTSTGSLYYDADGSGAGAAQLVATFSGNPGIAATDVVVI